MSKYYPENKAILNPTPAKPPVIKVCSVESSYRIIVNAGWRNGIQHGQHFAYGDGKVVNDPDTGEELGRLATVRFRAYDVYEKFSVLETFGNVMDGVSPPVVVNIGDEIRILR